MRSYHQLTREQRYQISALRSLDHNYAEIARTIGVHKSTISREMARHPWNRSRWWALVAHSRARYQRRKPVYRIPKEVWSEVDRLIREDWSPEQVSNRLRLEQGVRISPEWIYQHIFADQSRGGELYKHLRHQKKRQTGGRGWEQRGRPLNYPSIDLRPALVERRERLGDWEVDLLLGKRKGKALVTLTERKSRLTLLALVERRTAPAVREQICSRLRPYKDRLHSLTSDRGREFSEYAQIARALGIPFYFAHPYAAWERGTNENTNGLLRQYFPKSTSFKRVSEAQIEAVMQKLNQRPRKILGFRTPFEVFFDTSVALTS
jgi:transposase, IS30 family